MPTKKERKQRRLFRMPVEDATGYRLGAFDPMLRFTERKEGFNNRSFDLPVEAAIRLGNELSKEEGMEVLSGHKGGEGKWIYEGDIITGIVAKHGGS